MIEIVRRTSRNVKRWQSGEMCLRWTAAGMLEAEQQFRKIIGYRDLASSPPASSATSPPNAPRHTPRPVRRPLRSRPSDHTPGPPRREGILLQRHPLPEQRVDLHPPCVVTSVAEPVRKPDVVGGEVTSVCLESRIVVGSRLPIGPGPRRSRLEVATTAEAVALGHLAPHVDDLAIPSELPEDSSDSQVLEPLNWSFLSVRRCRRGSSLRDLLFVVHARALSPRRWRQSGYGR